MCASDQTGSAKGELLIENDKVKVWRWSFDKRGDNTGWHRHEHDYVVVPLFDGVLDIDVGAAEPVLAELQNGVPYFRENSSTTTGHKAFNTASASSAYCSPASAASISILKWCTPI